MSSNEHDFFFTVTSLTNICEGRIWDTGDALFPVTFKYFIAHYNQEGSETLLLNNVLMCIKNRADLPRPWTEVLAFQVLAN